MTVRNIEVICRHVAGLGTLNGLTVEEERAFERHVRASGLTVEEWIRRAGSKKKPLDTISYLRVSEPETRAVTELRSFDLDYWPPELEGKPTPMPPKRMPPPPQTDDGDDDSEPMPDDDDNDVAPEQSEKTCPSCGGTGRSKTGARCAQCNGSGRVPMNDVGDDGDEEEARSYGFIEDED
jgi:hypothetical protein